MATNSNVMALLDSFMGDMEKMAKQDDGTSAATEGARSSENTADVKKQVGSVSVDSTSPISSVAGAGESTPSNSMGTKKSPTGEDVPTTKKTVDDPGTSHPAKASGEKTAAQLIDTGNDILARIAVMAKEANTQKAAEKVTEKAAEKAAEKVDGVNPTDAATATSVIKPKKAPASPKAPDTVGEKVATVTISKDEYDSLSKLAESFEQLMGHMAGNAVSQEVLATQAKPAKAEKVAASKAGAITTAQIKQAAAEEAALMLVQANDHTTDLIDFLSGFSKKANGLEGAIDPAAMAAMGGAGAPPVDPAAMAAMGGAPAPQPSPEEMAMMGGGGQPAPQIDPALLQQLIAALQAQGLGGGMPGAAPQGAPAEGDAIDSAVAASVGEPSSNDEGSEATQKSESKEEGSSEEAKPEAKSKEEEAPAEEEAEDKTAKAKILQKAAAELLKELDKSGKKNK